MGSVRFLGDDYIQAIPFDSSLKVDDEPEGDVGGFTSEDGVGYFVCNEGSVVKVVEGSDGRWSVQQLVAGNGRWELEKTKHPTTWEQGTFVSDWGMLRDVSWVIFCGDNEFAATELAKLTSSKLLPSPIHLARKVIAVLDGFKGFGGLWWDDLGYSEKAGILLGLARALS